MKNPAAVELGKLGGKASAQVRTAAKARASRENGKLGGRPPANRKSQIANHKSHYVPHPPTPHVSTPQPPTPD